MKRLFDFTCATIALVLLSPLLLVLAGIVWATSEGPAFYCQKRVGRRGKLFTCMKFRTMRPNSDAQGSVTLSRDERLTGIGAFLRRWKLDELPQLFNVMIGSMSFVGPRPDVPGYADKLDGEDSIILEMRPGITGPATLLFRDEEYWLARAVDPVKFNDEVMFPKKVDVNLAYMKQRSFWKDIGYILATALPAFSKRAGLNRILGLHYYSFDQHMESRLQAFNRAKAG